MSGPDDRHRDGTLNAHRRVLRELRRHASLKKVLEAIVEEAERVVPRMRSSVLLVSDGRLYPGACPRLPRAFRDALHGLPIGPDVGSCGAAAATGRRVVVPDVREHPNWAPFLDLARLADIRASWSEPIFDSEGAVVGTFAMYYAEPREPDALELELIETLAQVASIAIESDRRERTLETGWKQTEESLRETGDRFRQMAEAIREVFWLTDWRTNEILYVSPAYETLWGRSCASLYADPGSWAEDIHPDDRERVFEEFRTGATLGTYETEYRLVRPDGVRWIYDRAFPIRDGEGRVYRVAGISEDVTARKSVELALERALAELDARSRARVRSLQTDLLLAEERERRRLAIDLHDGLNQLLTLAQMKLAGLRDATDATEGSVREAVAEIERVVAEADRSARTLTFQLSPPVLHDLGFEAAVQWLAEDVQSQYGLPVELVEHDPLGDLDEDVGVLLFRAVRELLINVARHAEADSARVRLHCAGGAVGVCVEDDGVAFDARDVGHRGVGLSSIRERLDSLGGSMEIRSEPGRGTAVTLSAPLRRPAVHQEAGA